MAYRIGQLRKQDIGVNNFMTKIESTVCIESSESPFHNLINRDKSQVFIEEETIGDLWYQDLCFDTGNEIGFKKGTTYFFQCKIKRVPEGTYEDHDFNKVSPSNDLGISIELREKDSFQCLELLDFIVVPRTTERPTERTQYYPYMIVFTPNISAQCLVLKLERTGYDALIGARTWLITGETDANNNYITLNNIKDVNFFILNNIISDPKHPWIRFGFQSRPGSLIVVNKAPIRVGRSGVYEINIGLNINSFMIAASGGNNNISPFLLDYAYIEEE